MWTETWACKWLECGRYLLTYKNEICAQNDWHSRSLNLLCLSEDKNHNHSWLVLNYTVSQKTHPKHFRLYLEQKLSDLNNFWYEYSWDNLSSNNSLVSHLTHSLFLHYLENAEPTKQYIFTQYSIIT